MDLLIFIFISGLVILSIVLILRHRLRKLDENKNDENGEINTLSRSARDYKIFKWLFFIAGIGSITNGLIRAIGIILNGGTNIQVWDAIFNTSFGIIYFICLWFYNNRNKNVIWIYGFSILLSIGYSFAVGRGFNYPMVIIGAYFIYQLFNLSKTNELIN